MTKYDYLTQLKYHLKPLPEKERVNAVNYYDKYFTQAGSENEEMLMKRLGTPKQLADRIIAKNANTIPGAVNETKKNVKKTAGSMKKSSLPKCILMFAAGGLIILVVILLLAAFALAVAGVLALMLVLGLAMMGMGFPYIFKLTSVGLITIGIGLVCVSVPILIFIPCMNLVFFVIRKTIVKTTGWINGRLKGKAAEKNEK